jgi:hypothetical protein
MWSLKSVYNSQSSTVVKLLKEDWEPFAVVNTGELNKKGKPVLKIFFRRLETVELPAAKSTSEIKVKIDATEIKKVMDKFSADILEEINKLRENLDIKSIRWGKFPPDSYTKVFSEPTKVSPTATSPKDEQDIQTLNHAEEDDLENVGRNEDEDYLKEDNPHGYKVVDEIPVEAQPPARTPQQEATIASIRSISNTNITTSPVQSDGVILVFVGNQIHYVKPDGDYTTEDSGAGTSSLSVP